jgi:diguanylate cyclase (GGDEF)-like protein
MASYTFACPVLWLSRWPTRRLSAFVCGVGAVLFAVWSIAQPIATTTALGGAALSVFGAYFAFVHSIKAILFNFALAVAVATVAALRLVSAVDWAMALATLWFICFLNAAIPAAIRAMSAAMGMYAQRCDEDALTGLLNRRAFIGAVTDVLKDPRNASASHLTVLMVDLDNFKRINDTRGHAEGDRALIAVAKLLRQHTPSNAVICRAGGEEFLVALVSDSGDTTSVADRLCTSVDSLSHRVTASIGAASTRIRADADVAPERLISRLIESADTAMYAAKRNGGNQVAHACAPDDEGHPR